MEKQAGGQTLINNDFYETLHDKWYTAEDHPIALLRAENAVRTPWVSGQISAHMAGPAQVLDIGCGGGFLTNHLALAGHTVTGIDLSQSSLAVARSYDSTKSVQYLYGNAYELPFEAGSFDIVCAMDILEHVENPTLLVQQAGRVLRKGGLFFFHTFNRNLLSYILVIKGVDWFVENAPKNMHVYDLFITPEEMRNICLTEQMEVVKLVGLVPNMWNTSFWKMLVTRKVPAGFSFSFVNSLKTGYCGIAIKQ